MLEFNLYLSDKKTERCSGKLLAPKSKTIQGIYLIARANFQVEFACVLYFIWKQTFQIAF